MRLLLISNFQQIVFNFHYRIAFFRIQYKVLVYCLYSFNLYRFFHLFALF